MHLAHQTFLFEAILKEFRSNGTISMLGEKITAPVHPPSSMNAPFVVVQKSLQVNVDHL